MLASRKVAQSSKRARAGPRLPPRRRYCPSSETVTEDLILTGAGLTATYSLDYRPVDQVWSRVTVLLHEAAGWVLQGSGQAPTRAQFEAILAGAAELRIRADYRNEPLSTAFLDNVELTGLPFVGAAFDAPPGDFSLLARNADGTYTRTLKDGTRLAYDSDGRLVAVVDRNGNETAYAYNADGLPPPPATLIASGGCGEYPQATMVNRGEAPMKHVKILAGLAVLAMLAGCSSPQDRAAKAQERSYEALEKAAQERLELVDKYQECVKAAGSDNEKIEACDTYLKAAEALR